MCAVQLVLVVGSGVVEECVPVREPGHTAGGQSELSVGLGEDERDHGSQADLHQGGDVTAEDVEAEPPGRAGRVVDGHPVGQQGEEDDEAEVEFVVEDDVILAFQTNRRLPGVDHSPASLTRATGGVAQTILQEKYNLQIDKIMHVVVSTNMSGANCQR